MFRLSDVEDGERDRCTTGPASCALLFWSAEHTPVFSMGFDCTFYSESLNFFVFSNWTLLSSYTHKTSQYPRQIFTFNDSEPKQTGINFRRRRFTKGESAPGHVTNHTQVCLFCTRLCEICNEIRNVKMGSSVLHIQDFTNQCNIIVIFLHSDQLFFI